MKVIYPDSFKNIPISELLRTKKIIDIKHNMPYNNTIFPKSTKIGNLNTFSRDKIITQIDDSFFGDFYIVDKMNQMIYANDNTTRKYIKCKEFGDIENSYKRYNNVNSPIDYNDDATSFLNINNLNPYLLEETSENINDDILNPTTMVHKSLTKTYNSLPQKIDTYNNQFTKFNDRTTLEYVIKWAKEQEIKYIYAIIENRPNVINTSFTLPFTYFTILGSK